MRLQSEHDKQASAWAARQAALPGQRAGTWGFKTALRALLEEAHRRFAEEEWEEEPAFGEELTCYCDACEAAREIDEGRRPGFIPDAWCIQPGAASTWSSGAEAVLMLCEVQHTSPVSGVKLWNYCNLFWVLDQVPIQLRLIVIDRCGVEREVDLVSHAHDQLVKDDLLPVRLVAEVAS